MLTFSDITESNETAPGDAGRGFACSRLAIDHLRDDGPVLPGKTSLDGFAQDFADEPRASRVEADVGCEIERVAQILQCVFGRERPLRKCAGNHGLQAMVAEREGIR